MGHIIFYVAPCHLNKRKTNESDGCSHTWPKDEPLLINNLILFLVFLLVSRYVHNNLQQLIRLIKNKMKTSYISNASIKPCIYIITFIITGYVLQLRFFRYAAANKICEYSNWFMRPVVFFEYITIIGRHFIIDD